MATKIEIKYRSLQTKVAKAEATYNRTRGARMDKGERFESRSESRARSAALTARNTLRDFEISNKMGSYAK